MSTVEQNLQAYSSKQIIVDSDIQKIWNFEYGDLKLVTNYDSIRQSIWTILQTKKGELPGLIEFGCVVHEYLFEQMSPSMIESLKTAIIADIQRFENRVNIIDFRYDLNNPPGTLKLDMVFQIKALGQRQYFRESYLLNSSTERKG